MTDLLPVEEAQRRLFDLARPVEAETVPIGEAAGRWLAQPVIAKRTQPDADLSAMDGYALRHRDLPGPLRVIGESAAGAPFAGTLSDREAVRIYTGAVVPHGADCVLIQEQAEREGDSLTLSSNGPEGPGAHIRKAGEDFGEGDTVIEHGSRITPSRIGLAIAAGHDTLSVNRTISLAIISTGDELRPPGTATEPGTLPASNGPMLAAMLSPLPVAVEDLGIVPDDLDAIGKALALAVKSDIVVTIGGASVGDRDLVRKALDDAGGKLDFWRIAMKPGKPLIAGTLGEAVLLGLPGNPASAFVTAKLFLEPLIAQMAGAGTPLPGFIEATLGVSLPATTIRAEYLRGTWRNGAVEPVSTQSSASLSSLGTAELLIERAAHAPTAAEGDPVRILPLA